MIALLNARTGQEVVRWISGITGGGACHSFHVAAIRSFIFGALAIRSVFPSHVGRTIAGNRDYPCHGMKCVYRLLDNRRITHSMILGVYLDRLRYYAARCKTLVLAVDWTVLHEKYNLLSVSLVTKGGRALPIAFDGYEIGKLKAFDSQNKIKE
jgi:hypothetical protein